MLWCALEHLPAHELRLISFFGMLLDEVGEEEALEHHEDDEDFDEDDRPQRLPQSHVSEALVIQVESPKEKARPSHRQVEQCFRYYICKIRENILMLSRLCPKKITKKRHSAIHPTNLIL